jgi:hypothetical protein
MSDDSADEEIRQMPDTSYQLKLNPRFKTFSRPISKKIRITGIGKSKRFKIIDVAPHNYSFVLHPEVNEKLQITHGGYFAVKKYEKGTRLKLGTKESKKNPSLAIGSKFLDIAELNYETDGQSGQEMEENVEEISNDIIVLEYHGGNSIFHKSDLTGFLTYLIIDKDIERELLKKEKEKAIEYINNEYNTNNFPHITDYIKRLIGYFL